MKLKDQNGLSSPDRGKEHTEMLEAALARPGVREMMEVYGDWQERDCGFDAFRTATKKSEPVTTTTSSNTS